MDSASLRPGLASIDTAHNQILHKLESGWRLVHAQQLSVPWRHSFQRTYATALISLENLLLRAYFVQKVNKQRAFVKNQTMCISIFQNSIMLLYQWETNQLSLRVMVKVHQLIVFPPLPSTDLPVRRSGRGEWLRPARYTDAHGEIISLATETGSSRQV